MLEILEQMEPHTFAVPKLIYPLTVIKSPSEAILKEVETSMFKFLWNCKPDKIKEIKLFKITTMMG